MTLPDDLEQRYRALEQRREVSMQDRVRRGQVGLLLALITALLLAGTTAAVDLRRLRTPEGTARAWAEATVFGDCDRHLSLSVAAPGAPVQDATLCRRLAAVPRVPGTTVRTRLLSRGATRASAEGVLVTPTRTVAVRLELRRRGAGWVVLRTPQACLLGCG